MSERGQPRLWITFDDARLLYAGLSEDKYHAWCFGKTGGVLMNSLVRAGLGFCLRWIWESYRLRVKSGWRCSAGVWVRCFAVAGCGVVGREGCSAIGLVSVWLFVSLVSCVVGSPVFPSPGCGASLLFIFIAVCPVPFRSVALAHYPSRSRLPRGRSFASVTDFSDGLASLIEQMYY